MEATHCKKCGKILEESEKEICFSCWLIEQQEHFNKKNTNIEYVSNSNQILTTPTYKKRSYQFKNTVWLISIILLLLIIVCATFFDIKKIFLSFIKVANKIGNGSLILGSLLLLFAIWGGIQIFRGFCEMCDNGKLSSIWAIISTIIGFVSLYISISRI